MASALPPRPPWTQSRGCSAFHRQVGGPYEDLGPWRGNNGVQSYFRLDMKRHPLDGALLCLTVGWAQARCLPPLISPDLP